jgi:hypothetical protein
MPETPALSSSPASGNAHSSPGTIRARPCGCSSGPHPTAATSTTSMRVARRQGLLPPRHPRRAPRPRDSSHHPRARRPTRPPPRPRTRSLVRLQRRALQEPQRRRTMLQPVEQWRGIATRNDKTASNYRGGVLLVSLVLWTPCMIQETRPSHAHSSSVGMAGFPRPSARSVDYETETTNRSRIETQRFGRVVSVSRR